MTLPGLATRLRRRTRNVANTEIPTFVKNTGFDSRVVERKGDKGYDKSIPGIYMDTAELNMDRNCISGGVRFYTIVELSKMLGWSEKTVQKLFNDPKFPSTDFGRNKVIEEHALIDYFSKRHEKARDRHWK